MVLLSKTIVWSIMLHALWNAIAVMKTLPTQEWRFSLAFGVSLITIIIIGLALRTRPGKTE